MKKRKPRNRIPAKVQQRNAVVGVGWYAPQDWERMKATATDADVFENTFEEWEAVANETLRLIRTTYPNAVKVLVSADKFSAWCLLRGRTNDSKARSEFVVKVLRNDQDAA